MQLIKDVNIRQRYYQLDFKVFKTKTGYIADIFKADPIRLIDGYELAEDVSECIDKICISDAHTHSERMVFPVFYVLNKKTGERILTHRNNAIAGCWTMMIHGGDPSSMRRPEVYERYLRVLNREYNS